MKPKAKPFPPCTHCGFNDHRPDDYKMYPECETCESNDHSTSGYNRIIYIKGGVLVEFSRSSESLVGLSCKTCGSTVLSTTDHSDFEHFKIETHQGAHLVPGQWMLKEYNRDMFDDKQGTIFNDNKEIVLVAPRRNFVYVLDMSSLTQSEACFFAKTSE
ncbi:hypothetical protein Tco_0740377, partial [Tanacetum coccineum]